jgi:hypothetical protein
MSEPVLLILEDDDKSTIHIPKPYPPVLSLKKREPLMHGG